ARLLSAFALRNGSGLPLARTRRRFALPSGASREPLALLACLCDATVNSSVDVVAIRRVLLFRRHEDPDRRHRSRSFPLSRHPHRRQSDRVPRSCRVQSLRLRHGVRESAAAGDRDRSAADLPAARLQSRDDVPRESAGAAGGVREEEIRRETESEEPRFVDDDLLRPLAPVLHHHSCQSVPIQPRIPVAGRRTRSLPAGDGELRQPADGRLLRAVDGRRRLASLARHRERVPVDGRRSPEVDAASAHDGQGHRGADGRRLHRHRAVGAFRGSAHVSPTKLDSNVPAGPIAAKSDRHDGDSVYRLFYDTVKGGDYRSREANVYRLAQLSVNIIDQCVAQGVPFARDYGGLLDNRSFGGAQVSRTFYARGQTGQQLLLGAYQSLMRQVHKGTVRLFARREMLDLVLVEGRARGIVCRNLVTGEIERYAAH